MKKKVLLSSILTIALCLCLIAGSTFALFTSTTKVDISVTAAKVKMEASVSELKLYSVKATAGGSIVDEFGGQYKYVDRTEAQAFANGGTAVFEDATLKLDRITPGDKVSFNIEGANTSDVTIQYRYVVECLSGEKLMSGLLVTIGDTTYPVLSNFTSAWSVLNPGSDITPVPVVIEFPVTAGNEYQELSTEIKVTVEAVQGNADVNGATPTVEFLNGYTADLGGQTLDDYIKNNGNTALANGTVVLDYVGVENFGNLTMDNMTIAAGANGYTSLGYAMNSKNGATTVLNNVDVAASNGAFGVTGGANLTYNGGRVYMYSTNTSGRYMFYVAGEGSVATINGGEFVDFTYIPEGFTKTQNQKRAYAYVGAGATLYINGGNFGKASTSKGYTAGLLGEGTIIITGGTFGFNPTQWVADGYQAIKNGSKWYVVPENVDAIVANQSQLQAALDAATGDYVINVVGSINGDVVAPQSPDVHVTVNGNGHTFAGVLTVNGKSGTYTTAALTIKDFVFAADSISADACIQLGKDNATRYTCNVTIDGCTFDVPGAVGVKSYTGGDKNVAIINCVATANAHSLAQLKGIDGVLIDNCTVNAVRGANLNNSDNIVVSNSTFNVEKYGLRFGESGNSVVENYAITNCTLVSECVEGDAVIVLRAGATDANLTITNTVIEGEIAFTGIENANVTIQ